MKNTGIVRRIDELGRIVIPKELRKVLRLYVGSQLEIYTTENNELVLKKHSAISEIKNYADLFCKSLADSFEQTVVICDTDKILSVANGAKKDYLNKKISHNIDNVLFSKKSYILNASDGGAIGPVYENDNSEYSAQIIVPILSNYDVIGGIVIVSKNKDFSFQNTDAKTVQTVVNILSSILG